MSREATIYVVDDDDAVRDSVRALLECEGFTVFDFASCGEFLRLAHPGGGSCLVLDVHMPGMSGLELLDRIRRDNMIIAVIVMTGRPNAAITEAAARAGAAVLEKPFRVGELVSAIERARRTVDKRIEQ